MPMPWTYRPALDGLRTIAVYLVVLFHAGLAWAAGGFIGVDLFFVLSGFLVSSVILSELDRTGRLDIGRFYARRVRRLLPAAVVVIVATATVFLLITPLARRLPLVGDAQSALLYVANWNFLFKQQDYFASGIDESPFLHFWSLAIEEQFYLFFPLLLVFLFRRSAKHPRLIPAVVGGLLAASLVSQLVWAQLNVSWAYYGTDARLYQMLAGVLLALGLRALAARPSVRPTGRAGGLVAGVGLVSMLVLGSGLLELTPSWRGILATVASVALVGGIMLSEDGFLSRQLSRHIPVFLGKVSYGTYLWHWPVILVLTEVLEIKPLTVAALAIGLSTGLAALSFQVLETPIRSAQALHPFRWQTALVGLTSSAAVAALVVPVVLSSERTPRLASTAVASVPVASVMPEPSEAALRDSDVREVSRADRKAPVPSGIDYEKLMKEPDDYPPCTPEDPDACVLVKGSGTHIALVGDSHAEMLIAMFKKLAQEHDLTLSVNAVRGCPWQAGVVDSDFDEERATECLDSRGPWYDKVLPELDPDVVVLSAMAREDGRWKKRLVRADGSTEDDVRELVFNSTKETVEQISAQGRRVVMLNSLPLTGNRDPLECLSAAETLEQCSVPIEEQPASDTFYETVASLSDNVYTADVADVFCDGAPLCLPVVDDIVVWKDKLHLTEDIVVHRREAVWRRLKQSGVLRGI